MSISKGTSFSISSDPLPENSTAKDYELLKFVEVGASEFVADIKVNPDYFLSVKSYSKDYSELLFSIESHDDVKASVSMDKKEALEMAQSIINLYK